MIRGWQKMLAYTSHVVIMIRGWQKMLAWVQRIDKTLILWIVRKTVEPPSKEHFGSKPSVPNLEIVPLVENLQPLSIRAKWIIAISMARYMQVKDYVILLLVSCRDSVQLMISS